MGCMARCPSSLQYVRTDRWYANLVGSYFLNGAIEIVKNCLVTNRLQKKIAQLEEEEELITGEAAGIGLQGGDVTSFGVQSLE